MASDKNTIGLTADGRRVLDELLATERFNNGIDVAKFAMAVAVAAGASPSSVEGAGTVWNVGSFDEDGELRDLIQALYPDTQTPYRAVESLVETGLAIIDKQRRPFDIVELMGLREEVAP
jgi:hypothetical protein